MSNARYILNPNSWAQVVNHLFPSSKKRQSGSLPVDGDTAKVHCRYPICVGYKEKVVLDKIRAVIQGCYDQRYDWTIYLAPKDDKALADLLKTNEFAEFMQEYPDKIILISKWRETAAWKTASTRYNELREGPQKTTFATSLGDDVGKFWERHKEVPAYQIKDHIIQEVKDCVSWMTPIDAVGDDANIVNVLMYEHDLTQSMYEAFQNAAKMSYKSSLIHSKFSITPNPDFKEGSPAVVPAKSESIPVGAPKLDSATSPKLQESGGAFERAFVLVTTKGKQHQGLDLDSSAQLLLKLHQLERTSPSSSPENKYVDFARESARGRDDVEVYSMPLEDGREVLAVGEVSSSDPSKVVSFKHPSESLKQQSFFTQRPQFTATSAKPESTAIRPQNTATSAKPESTTKESSAEHKM